MSATTTPYKPQAGSIAAQALTALAKSDNGRMASAVLLDAIGQPHSYTGLSPCLALCVDNGLITKEREGHLTFWSLTAAGMAMVRELSLTGHAIKVAKEQGAARAPDAPPKAALETAADEPPADVGADFALTANGRLLIEANGRQVMLNQTQTDKLIGYIDAQRGVEWEPA